MGGGLSDHEQRILEDIERRLQEEDPRLAQAVARTSLYSHVARRIRFGVLAFLGGFVGLLFFAASIWYAVGGFAVMLTSGLYIWSQLRRLRQDQLREASALSPAGWIARLMERWGRGRQGGRG